MSFAVSSCDQSSVAKWRSRDIRDQDPPSFLSSNTFQHKDLTDTTSCTYKLLLLIISISSAWPNLPRSLNIMTDNEKLEDIDQTDANVDTTTRDVDTTTRDVDTTTRDVDTTTRDVDTTTRDVDTTTKDVDNTTKDLDATKGKSDSNQTQFVPVHENERMCSMKIDPASADSLYQCVFKAILSDGEGVVIHWSLFNSIPLKERRIDLGKLKSEMVLTPTAEDPNQLEERLTGYKISVASYQGPDQELMIVGETYVGSLPCSTIYPVTVRRSSQAADMIRFHLLRVCHA